MSLPPVRAAFQVVGLRSRIKQLAENWENPLKKELKTHVKVIVNLRYLLLKTSELALKELADHPLR